MERVSVTELIAAVAIIIALVWFALDLQNREEGRVNRAWSLAPQAPPEMTQ
jgi:steroid 5-alpha reductase family enzyme